MIVRMDELPEAQAKRNGAGMAQSLPMRRHAERLIATGTDAVRVDLRDCTHADSTFLGTLLGLMG